MSNNKQAKPKQTKSEKLQKSAKCKNNHFSPMSNTAWSDLNTEGDILKFNGL